MQQAANWSAVASGYARLVEYFTGYADEALRRVPLSESDIPEGSAELTAEAILTVGVS